MTGKYIYTIGKRKTATAQVKLFDGKGEDTVNGKKISEYIKRKDLFDMVYAALKLCKLKDKKYFEIRVVGSGDSAQAQAMRHGIARAVSTIDETNRKLLKQDGLLTRDARKVERKKPGRHKARKGMQWSKR